MTDSTWPVPTKAKIFSIYYLEKKMFAELWIMVLTGFAGMFKK